MQKTASTSSLPASQPGTPTSSPLGISSELSQRYFHGPAVGKMKQLELNPATHRLAHYYAALSEMRSIKTPMLFLTAPKQLGRVYWMSIFEGFKVTLHDITEQESEFSANAQFGYVNAQTLEENLSMKCYEKVPEAAFFSGQSPLASHGGEGMDERFSITYAEYMGLSVRERGLLEEIRGVMWQFTNLAAKKATDEIRRLSNSLFRSSYGQTQASSQLVRSITAKIQAATEQKNEIDALRTEPGLWKIMANFVIERREAISRANPNNPVLATLLPVPEEVEKVLNLISTHYKTL